jgi:hypothetical protein
MTENMTAYESLNQQILEKQADKENDSKNQESTNRQGQTNEDIRQDGDERSTRSQDENQRKGKTFRFTKGEENFEIDEDAEFEFLADKRPVKMTMKQMRDAAAGGIAVRNRMRQIAEEKKSLLDPYKEFSKSYKEDPFNALKKVFKSVQAVDPEANFDEFIASLGKQAQSVAQMDPNARKAYLLEKELKEANGRVTEAEQMQNLAKLKQELIEETGLPDEKIFKFGQQILSNPVLAATVKNEEDLIARIGDLAEEIEMQKASHEALRKYDSGISPRDPLVFELSNLLKQNPDFDERDLEDVAKGVLGSVQKTQASERLSKKQRPWISGSRGKTTSSNPDYSRMTPFQALKHQIENKKKQQLQKK